MQAQQLLRADLLDIIFENRNKAYGAYALRKHYNNRLVRALTVMIFSVGVVTLVALIPDWESVNLKPSIFDDTRLISIVDPPAPEPPKPPAQRSPQQPPHRTQEFLGNPVITERAPRINDLADSIDIDSRTVLTDAPRIVDPYPPAEPGPIAAPAAPIAPVPVDIVTPRLTADVMPAFPGGPAALRKFLEKNLQSPGEQSADEFVQVKMKFIVGYDGYLKGFETVQDGGIAFNNEVLRVLKKMPRWTPGKASGENVSVYYTLPVKFAGTE